MNKKGKSSSGDQLICRNPKAERNFDVEERIEAGIVLTGSEVKSLRAKHADLEGAYASIENMELFLFHMHIGPYAQAGRFGHEEKRRRKLLVHKREIERLTGRIATRGYALVPAKVYWKEGRAKVELVLGKGRKVHDDRESIKRELDLKEARAAMARRRS
ncbi:MAG TPA: SsrA-binding protein SmpB [Polyangiales bacterium]|nr:SsrA-binding protein SmpB [Polyangiales bacterium]